MAFVWAWARAFVVTQAIEAPIYRYGYGASLPVALGASAITHPIVWFGFFGLFGLSEHLSYGTLLVLAETFAVLVEAVWLHLMARRPHAAAWALAANVASVAIGTEMRALFGFP